ncbi:Cysteine-rich receptor-like protein kinase 29 [Striga hermonthica]|uniref:Cysteine-rich receptor-like protein kinase 29 n=1 Tax=Striga hermonthica TaxID=68872 RepID=A0A9N7NTU1_STRHE|nr:Cysteine-rich receptor-like protein kinase 29 [Striga hermonthica]
MVQCTPDLSAEDCGRCLVEAAGALSDCCRGSVGARVNLPSCNIRYEISPFYNESRLEELAGGHHTDEPGQPTRDPPLPPKPGVQKGNNITRVVVITVISVVACAMFFVFVCLVLRKKMRRKPEENHETAANEVSSDESVVYALSTIRDATKDFSDDYKMGQGGFGPVYKGILPSGEEVAVKRLSQYSRQGDLEFKNEVLLLAKLQHRNLVRLLGFCLEGKEKLLVYEFMQNASLDHFIFDPIKRSYLDWEKRFKIIIGVARGILYLHEDSQLKIIHRDLKPSNVLLDGSMNAKIADFGTARLFAQDETHGSTSRIAGTLGYMAPEYAVHGKFSIKSDVYSFGVLLLEIISGQKNNRVREGENVEDLLSFVWRHWREGTAEQVLDPCLRSSSGFFINDVVRFIHIALLCVQEKATDRPTMASVIVMLSSSSLKLATPIEPASFMPADYGSETSLL